MIGQTDKPRRSFGWVAGALVVAGAALIGVGVFAGGLGRQADGARPESAAVVVTLYPQPTVPATATAAPTPTSAPAATATPEPRTYAIQPGDTLWEIALKFDVSLDALTLANPGVNASLLQIGRVLIIPPGGTIAAAAAHQPERVIEGDAEVADQPDVRQNAGLNLRKEPGYTTEVTAKLAPFTPVKIIGRTEDAAWAQVQTDDGRRGWVFVAYLDLNGKFEYGKVAVTSRQVVTVPIAQAAAQTPATGAKVTAGPLSYPYLNIGVRAKAIFEDGKKKGNRPGAFSLIGDSNTENPAFFKPFDWGAYSLASYTYLQPTVDFFRGSFGRVSAAAFGGWNTSAELDASRAPGGCNGEAPLRCELNQNKPSVALILLGTGDQHTWQGFEQRYRRIIEDTINAGVIPVLLTKMDDLETRDNNAPPGYINGIIRRLAGEYQVPLLDNRAVMDKLPNRGAIEDGFHYNKPADNQTANFAPEYLQYGFNQRNLTALQALDVIRRAVMGL